MHQNQNVKKATPITDALLEPSAPDYTLLYPDMVFETGKAVVTPEEKTAYFTFDDGPSVLTEVVLDALENADAKATFFLMGTQLDDAANVQRLHKIINAGHAVGVHSQTHNYLEIYASVESFLFDIYQIWSRIYKETGIKTRLCRFAGGSQNRYNEAIYPALAAEMTRRGFTFYDWHVSAKDGMDPGTVESVYQNATDYQGFAHPVVLMHDSAVKVPTSQALPQIIQAYKAAGYKLLPLDETVASISRIPFYKMNSGL